MAITPVKADVSDAASETGVKVGSNTEEASDRGPVDDGDCFVLSLSSCNKSDLMGSRSHCNDHMMIT